MDQSSWTTHCIETSLAKLTLSTKCIKQSASFLLTMPEHADIMSKVWLQSFRSALDPSTQLALLYVLNEIIHKCASYGSPDVKNSFKDPLIEAIKCLRPGLLVKKVKKLLLMWVESTLFDRKFNNQLIRIASPSAQNTSQAENEEAAVIKDFTPDKFIKHLQGFKHLDETIMTYSESDLIPACFSLPIDTIVRRMKSKEEGESFARQVKTCASQLDKALGEMDRKLSAQEDAIKYVDKAAIFYSIQQKEALVVANAYKSYEEQVRNTLSTLRHNLGIEEDEKSPVAVDMTTDDEGVANDLPNASTPPKFFEDEDDYVDAGSGGGIHDDDDGVVEMEADDEEEPPDPFGIRGSNRSSSGTTLEPVDVRNLLVDPKSLKDYPFNDSIVVDAQGDVDYRPMFEKMKEDGTANESSVDTHDAGVVGVNDAHEEAKKVASSIPMGDFDYRQSPPKSKTSEDPQKSIEDTEETTKSSDPFGLGDVASKDADLRFLQHPPPPVPVADLDYRQVPPTRPPTWLPSLVGPITNNLSIDSDLRQHQAAAAATAAAIYNVALVNAAARQAQTAAAVHAASLLYAPPLPSLLQLSLQPPPSVPMVSTPPAPGHAPASQSSWSSREVLDVRRVEKASPPPPVGPQMQQALPPQAPQSRIQATTSSALPNISADLLSNLKKINLPKLAMPDTVSIDTAQKELRASLTGKLEDKTEGEDPFAIISRLTGLSNLIQSARPRNEPVKIPKSSPKESSSSSASASQLLSTPKEPSQPPHLSPPKQTPSYTDDSSDEEPPPQKASTTGFPPSSSNSHSSTSTIKMAQGGEGEEEEGDQDGGATPTQDEDDTSFANSRVLTGTPGPFYHQTNAVSGSLSQPGFPSSSLLPPTLPPGTAPAHSSNILPFSFPRMPTFNPLSTAAVAAISTGQPTQLPFMRPPPSWQVTADHSGRTPTSIPPQLFFQNTFGRVLPKQ